MKRTPLRPSSSPIRANRTRKAKEFARCYHSVRRVEFVKSFPCIALWRSPEPCEGPIENAHIEGGGMGRKADHTKIVPACSHHHHEMHDGIETFKAKHGVDLEVLAAQLQALWDLVA